MASLRLGGNVNLTFEVVRVVGGGVVLVVLKVLDIVEVIDVRA